MKSLALAIGAALVLGACATANTGNGAPALASAAGTQYCWQDRLSNASGQLTCNWAADKRAACAGAEFTTVEATRFSEPKKSTMCANGQWLVEVAPGRG
jgi:PBP1b-binding outer membrane lipoprotein LpoB